MSGSERTIDDELTELGVAIVGDINLELIGKAKAQLESPDIKRRHIRQTQLRWDSSCEAIAKDFEAVGETINYMYRPDENTETKTEHHILVRKAVPEPLVYLLPRSSSNVGDL